MPNILNQERKGLSTTQFLEVSLGWLESRVAHGRRQQIMVEENSKTARTKREGAAATARAAASLLMRLWEDS